MPSLTVEAQLSPSGSHDYSWPTKIGVASNSVPSSVVGQSFRFYRRGCRRDNGCVAVFCFGHVAAPFWPVATLSVQASDTPLHFFGTEMRNMSLTPRQQ